MLILHHRCRCCSVILLTVITLMLFLSVDGSETSLQGSPSIQQQRRQKQQRMERKLIINGTKAEKGRYPYFVSLNHLCGGALIAPDIVLTAGHCKGREHIYARVGTYSFHNDIKGYDYEEIRISKQVRHPSFVWLGDDEFVHDFLLFKLKHPSSQPTIKLNPHVHIPTMYENVIAMGVGNTNPDYESKSNTLMEVSLTAIPNEICEQSYDVDRNISYAHRIHPSMMCTTGGTNNERDACSYDSGSPIIIPGESVEDDVLVALVSWGEECADPQFPGVNSRISDAYDWIRATVCAMSHYPPDELCHTDDDNIVIATTSNFFSNISHQPWMAWICQGLIIALCVVGTFMLVDRLTVCRRRCRNNADNDDDDLSPRIVIDEMTRLTKRHKSWTKMRSYDSAEVDILHPSAE